MPPPQLVAFSASALAELLTMRSLLKLLQTPVGLLFFRTAIIPGYQQQLRAWGIGRAASPLHVSLQFGWLHVAQPIFSTSIEGMVRCLVRTISEVEFVTTISRACCAVAVYAGAIQWLCGASIVCEATHDALLQADAGFPSMESSAINCSTWFELFGKSEETAFAIYSRTRGGDAFECSAGTFVHYLDFLYYSIVTASTVGFGDYSPSSTTARVITALYVLIIVACPSPRPSNCPAALTLPTHHVSRTTHGAHLTLQPP